MKEKKRNIIKKSESTRAEYLERDQNLMIYAHFGGNSIAFREAFRLAEFEI